MISRRYILFLVVGIIAATIYLINFFYKNSPSSRDEVLVAPRVSLEEKSKKYELAKEITTPDGFINTNNQPIAISDYVGKKVILVDFWTYSCINCQRTIPYLNSWYEKYRDKGFVIVGMHTPEFEFEKNYQNVTSAVEKFAVKYPVVLDNDYSTWNAYRNRYWPRKYLIDIDGYIVYDHIGEGAYEETEKRIQEALEERMKVLGKNETIDQPLTKESSVDTQAQSPETYFGASRNNLFSNGESGITGNQTSLRIPSQINPNKLYLSGDWNIDDEFAQNNSEKASIVYQYNAKDVFFVAEADSNVIVEVLLDGKLVTEHKGEDINVADGKTFVEIKGARLYKVIQGNQAEIHTLELRIQKPGLKAFTFTFG